MPLPLLPDVVALTITALRAQASVAALVGQRVYDRIPGTPTWPLLAVSGVSRTPQLEPRMVLALVQVDCWGAGGDPSQTAQADLLARTVWSVAPDLKGTWPPTAGAVAVCAPDLLLPQPDTTTGRARFIVQLQITATPEAS